MFAFHAVSPPDSADIFLYYKRRESAVQLSRKHLFFFSFPFRRNLTFG